ncbi:MAG TPA: DNA-processing protein DprA [Armatimonadota bacterium]
MSDIANWIRLAKLEFPKRAVTLLDHFGSPEAIFQASTHEFMDVQGITAKTVEKIRALAQQPVEKEIQALEKIDARIVTYHDPDYPQNLRQIFDPPAVLFVRGEILEGDRFAVAVIGTRKPSEYGRSLAMKISSDLSKRGLTIVSGGARGIDTSAHTATVQSGGRTLAVLGCGIDVAYPYENRGLFTKIAETGALISEFVPGTKPDAWRFPARNRLISGLSLGVLVVESKASGGAMITATIAAEQGRDVWALPGGTDSEVSVGPHRLIKDGAKLIESADDILAELGIESEAPEREHASLPSNLTVEQSAIVQLLSLHPKHVDDIIQESGLSAAAANSNLTILEMLGLIRRVPGNSYVRAL